MTIKFKVGKTSQSAGMTMEIARTILSQLGGNKFIAMTGARNLAAGNYFLSFKVGRNAKNVTHVRITLTDYDDYTMEFMTIRKSSVTIYRREGVYCDNLQTVFTSETGLDTHL